MILDNIIKLFSSQYRQTVASENGDTFAAEYSFTEFNLPSQNALDEQLKNISERDNLIIDIIIGDVGIETVSSKILNTRYFLDNVRNKQESLDDGEVIKAKLKISKKILDNSLSIYNLNHFLNYLTSESVDNVLDLFNSKIHYINFTFITFDQSGYLATSKFIFTSHQQQFSNSVSEAERKRRIDGLTNSCHYSGSSRYKLLPEDFQVINSPSENFSALNTFFNCLYVAHSLISICDISTITTGGFYFKINGYKSISNDIAIKDLPISSMQDYYDIYKWIYQEGNLYDKIGLARNIISLHLTGESPLALEPEIFQSIKSAHKIYLESNVKQYIEIRNKVSDQLLEFNKRAIGIVDAYAGNFQKSIFAFLTFLISMIVLRLANKEGEISISSSAAILCIGIYFAVVVYIIYSRWELDEQKKRFSKSYMDMKLRFRDILEEKDIARILRNDADYNSDLSFINEKKKVYTEMWILVMGIFAIALYFLYFKKLFMLIAILIRHLIYHLSKSL